MHITSASALWFLPFLTPIAIWVAWSDLKFMKIPNVAVIATLIVFVVVGLVALPFDDYLRRYVHFAVVLGIGFVGNFLRLFGAGDAKFGAAMVLFLPLNDLGPFLQVLAITLLAAFLTHRLAGKIPYIQRTAPDWESWQRREFPMGFALGSALIFYLGLGAYFGR